MPSVQVRDVPEDVHAALVRRAELAGQSLQRYLAAQLSQLVSTPTVEEVLARIEQRTGGRMTGEEAVAAVEAERDRR